MIKIIGLFPLVGNGGIASWTKTFLREFPYTDFSITAINTTAPGGYNSLPLWKRMVYGLYTAIRVVRDLKKVIRKEHFEIMHTTTSGNLGSLRDYMVSKVCHRHGIKTIIHCRYGCIPEDYVSKGYIGRLLRATLNCYDQIWVLDKRTYNFLKQQNVLKGKVFLTPNPIEIKYKLDCLPKTYREVGFVGNVLETKGIKELTRAVVSLTDTRLIIVGPANDEMVSALKEISGEKWGKYIIYHGRVPNDKAISLMKSMDIVALPTYYRSEAFPMSIIESMSLSKMVISCDRAAIPDMLTALDGSKCGLLVEPMSSEAIIEAIEWCQNNKEEADEMCMKAYQKVITCYSKEVVYNIYRNNYTLLLNNR